MNNIIKTGAALTALICSPFALAGGEGWTADFAGAQKQAAESGKDLLVDFTGSDWCGWCIKLNKEVFSHEPFKEGVKDKFVLVELDFPRDKEKAGVSEETAKQNEELGKKYAIKGYPTILLCDASGKPFASTGYQAGGPEKYVESLDTLRKAKATRDESLAAAAKLEGVAKAKALVAALDAMKLDDAMVGNFYGDVVEQIKSSDPKDETGFAKAATARENKEKFQQELQQALQGRDMDKALTLLDGAIQDGSGEKEELQQMMMLRASILAQQGKFDEALKGADEAKAAAPESRMAGAIDGFKKRVEEGKAKAAEGGDKPEEKKEEEKPKATERKPVTSGT